MNFSELIELGDPDEVIREIERRVSSRDWDGLLQLRDRCHAAVERGKQLWGAAAHAEYRLALQAPGEFAAAALDSKPGLLAIGPLPEVAASSHRWDELAPHVTDGPTRGITVYECVVRGEDLSGEADLHQHIESFELPLQLQAWEPAYPLAEYQPYEGRFPPPSTTTIAVAEVAPTDWSVIDEPEVVSALSELTAAWASQSNGRTAVRVVEGGLAQAVSAIDVCGPVHRISPADAMAVMAWAGASGGAHARRAGMAAGRAKAWWALANLAGVADRWPIEPHELGELASELEWWTWGEPMDVSARGWALRVAVVDPMDGMAFAIEATDSVLVPR